MMHQEAAVFCLEEVLECIQLCILLAIVITIHVRLNQRDSFGDKQYDIPKRFILMIYSFYASSTIHAISNIAIFLINHDHEKTSRYFGGSLSSWCHPMVYINISSAALYVLLLINILTERTALAFQDTAHELPKCLDYSIRMSALLIWATLIILDPIVSDQTSTYGHCVHALSQSHLTFLCVELFLILALYTTAISVMFIFKLHSFRKQLFEHRDVARNEGDDFLLELMKKQSIIMFWVSLTTAICFIVTVVVPDEIHSIPIICDFAANGIAIFLSFSFNHKLYSLCGCNRCANFCYLWMIERGNDEMNCIEFNKADGAPPGRQQGVEAEAVSRDAEQQQQHQDTGKATTDGVEGGVALEIAETMGQSDENRSAENEHKAPQNQKSRHNKTVTLTLEIGRRRKDSNESMLESAARSS